MYQWTKKGLVFPVTEYSQGDWMLEFAQAPASLILEDRVRVFFSCRGLASEAGQYTSYCSFVDFSRDDLSRVLGVSPQPVLRPGGKGEFDEFGVYPMSVVCQDKELWAYFAGWTRCSSVPFNTAIGWAKSNDFGKSFTKQGRGPVLSYSLHEPFVLSGPKVRAFNGKLYMFYIAGSHWLRNGADKPEPVYKIRLAVSQDGVNWDKFNQNLIQDKLGPDEAQASPDVVWANGKFHMFYCYRQGLNYRGKEGGYRIGYAWSNDLETWHREDDQAGLDVSAEGWDSEMVSYPHLLTLDGRTYMFYLGNSVGKEGFGLAELEGQL